MSKVIEVQGLGNVEFPDTMPDDQISTAIQSELKTRLSPQQPKEPSWLASLTTEPAKRIGSMILNAPGALYRGITRPIEAAKQIDWKDALTNPSQIGQAALQTGRDIDTTMRQNLPEITGGALGLALGGPLGVPVGTGVARAGTEYVKGAAPKEAATQGVMSGGLQALTQFLPWLTGRGRYEPSLSKSVAYEETGVSPSLGDITGKWGPQKAESIAGRGAVGAGHIQDFQSQQLHDLNKAFRGQVEKMGGVPDRYSLGENVAKETEASVAKAKKADAAHRKQLGEAMKGQTVSREPVINEAEQLAGEIQQANPALREKLGPVEKVLKGLSKRTEEAKTAKTGLVDQYGKPIEKVIEPERDLTKQTYQQWDIDKTITGKLGRSSDITAPHEKGYFKDIYRSEMEAIEQALDQAGLPPETAKAIGQYYKKNVVDVEDTMPGKMAKGGMNPEQVGGMFSKEGLTPLMDLKKWAPQQFENVRNRGFIDMLERSGAIHWEQGVFDPGKFAKVWRGIKDDVKEVAFTPEQRSRFDMVAEVADDLQRKGVAPGKSPGQGSNLPLWQILGMMGGGGAAGYLKNPLAAVPSLAFLLGPAAAGRAVTSPSLLNHLTNPITRGGRMGISVGTSVGTSKKRE